MRWQGNCLIKTKLLFFRFTKSANIVFSGMMEQLLYETFHKPFASSRQCGCDPLYGPHNYGTQTRTCVNGSWSAWSECTGYSRYSRTQCDGGGDEEYECQSDSAGNFQWEQITACSGGGDEPKRYEWELSCYNAWPCCSYCPTSSAESQCRGSCTTPGESFQVDGWLYPDDPHGCVDGESCTCTCVEI